MGDVLAQLPQLAVAAQVPRRARAVDGLDEQRIELAHGALHGAVAGRDVRAQGPLEHALDLAAQREQPGLPLAVVGDAGEAAVVQLVAAVEGELEVVAVGVGVGGVGAQGRLAAQRGEHRGRERAPGARQRRTGQLVAVRCG